MMKILVVLILSAVLILFGLFSDEIQPASRTLLDRVVLLGPWAFAAYSLSVAILVVSLLPGIVLTMGGGFLFGPWEGTLFFVLGETIGATLAFAMARVLLRDRLRAYFLRNPRLSALEEALAGEGWRFVALTRMTPFFPFKLSNYFFGSSSVRFRDFFWGSLFGTLPASFALVYLGSIAGDLASMEEGGFWDSPVTLGISAVTGGLALAGMAWMSKRAGLAYTRKLKSDQHG